MAVGGQWEDRGERAERQGSESGSHSEEESDGNSTPGSVQPRYCSTRKGRSAWACPRLVALAQKRRHSDGLLSRAARSIRQRELRQHGATAWRF